MKTRIFVSLLAVGVLLSGLPTRAQDAQSILSRVAAAYKNAKSYEAQTTITETRQMGGQQQKRTTTRTTRFKAPNKMVTIVQGSENMQIYSDGKTMYLYSPKEKQFMKMPAPTSFNQPGSGAMGAGDPSQLGAQLRAILGANAKKLADRNVGGKPMFVLQSTQSGQSQDGKSSFKMTATAYIDKATYLVRQIVLDGTQTQGNQKLAQTVTVSFTSQKINPSLPDSLFVFKPPAGARERQMQAPPGPPGAPR